MNLPSRHFRVADHIMIIFFVTFAKTLKGVNCSWNNPKENKLILRQWFCVPSLKNTLAS